MKNMFKTLLAIFSSLVISTSAFAGELSVSGSAEATYIVGGADDSNSKGLGISNELNFTATGEFANGYTWSYSMELDGASTANDDSQLVLGLADLGNAAICISECGLSTELSYGIGAFGVGSDIVNTGSIKFGSLDVSSYNNVQYHTPAGLLPFGVTAKVAYVPNTAGTAGSSAKEGNTIESTTNADGVTTTAGIGQDASMYQITAAPIDGLTVGADYFRADGSTATSQSPEGGNAFAKYAMGPVVVGYARSLVAPGFSQTTGTAATQLYETDSYGIQFAVNEAMSVSYNKEKSTKTTNAGVAATKTTATKTRVEADVDTYQVAYNIGGATIAIVKSEADNAGYTVNKEVSATLVSLKMAF
jgi:hypothetical protein